MSLRADGVGAWVAVGACFFAVLPAGLRWLRVAQREHYLAGSCSRFAVRWWGRTWPNQVLGLAAVAGLVLSTRWPLCALAPALVVTGGPWRLSLRGRTSSLAWTRRLRSLAVAWLTLQAAIAVMAAVERPSPILAAAGCLLVPLVLDLALLIMAPVERLLGGRFVSTATARLAAVRPIVVGITGSYGKTSTKSHIAHLVGGSRRLVATPASFNNRAGLARSVNEHLATGTEIFVAEMGTYGPGEIAGLCRWCPPSIAVITAIGPVHLERFGSEDRILDAKEEIIESAATVVLNVDDARLAALADRVVAGSDPKRVVRAGTDQSADVRIHGDSEQIWLTIRSQGVAEALTVPPGVQLTNLACAVAVGIELGVGVERLVERCTDLPSVAHRRSVATAPSGVWVIDDTFNSNPAGARSALALLASTGTGRRTLVTPGMVELGTRQRSENEQLAAEASAVVSDMVVVGRTNRRALQAGSQPEVTALVVPTREDAVAWVRSHLEAGDAVLYENDLPDHYP
jgi:UDP-N-acetylmuramoyl-tripeptide--D-alanyl-D-alanine ligase